MRLGLVGSGPQADRYASSKNGGHNIRARVGGRVSASEYRSFLDSVDGVIIATHPAGHRDLAMLAIEAEKPVLVEKPLAMNRAHCDELIDAARSAWTPLEVAHTRLWSREWNPVRHEDAYAVASYSEHRHDYSPWLDWGPHTLSALADAMPNATPTKLRAHSSVSKEDEASFRVFGDSWSYQPTREAVPPMLVMVADFLEKLHLGLHEKNAYWLQRYDFNRRVYRALFAE